MMGTWGEYPTENDLKEQNINVNNHTKLPPKCLSCAFEDLYMALSFSPIYIPQDIPILNRVPTTKPLIFLMFWGRQIGPKTHNTVSMTHRKEVSCEYPACSAHPTLNGERRKTESFFSVTNKGIVLCPSFSALKKEERDREN